MTLEQLEDLYNCNIIDVSDVMECDTILIISDSWDSVIETDSKHLRESLYENY